MTNEYTPTTEEQWALVDMLRALIEESRDEPQFTVGEHALMGAGEILRDWLAAHDRRVAAKALRDASTGTLAWIVKPTPDGEWTSVARWLRTRADRIERGE